MLDKFFELLERIANALEAIAAANYGMAEKSSSTQPAAAPAQENAGIDWEAIKDNREVLLKMCEDRGKTIPPRTKTPTLLKWLQDYEAAKANTPGEKQAEPTPDSEPAAGPGPAEDDPFGATVPEPEPVTREDVLKVLMAVKDAKDTAAVSALLTKFGGVQRVSELKEDKFQVVMDEAKKLLG